MNSSPQNGSSNPSGPLQYGILGDDDATDSEKLEKYTGEVEWSYLKKHFESGALLYIDVTLDLVEVGKAIADDDSETVLFWKKSGDLVQPSQPHAEYWEATNAKFLALVVSPLVLIQPVE